MKTILKTICEQAFHSQENGNLNIIGIFENIQAQKLPAIHAGITFVLAVEGRPGEKFDYYPKIEDPSGGVVLDGSKGPSSATIGPNGKIHIIYNIRNVKLEKEGIYTAKLHAGNLVESLTFLVSILPKAPIV